ncbi:autoinducer [Halalkalibacter alkalisediminis]|uniref:Autoinducer n=1 Tax=Halalkalibacter alkalisediminis TaxID=935616 RepID=A0ABV6NHC8_9BACI|nr:autoinducer [Halalkalibacter alkalisediminis]
MNVKLITYMALAICLSFGAFSSLVVVANYNDEKEVEEFVKGNNYLPVKEAIAIFEKKVNKKVSLPSVLPFEPTHRFGKVTDNGDLQIHYMKLNHDHHEDFIFYIMYPDSEMDQHLTQEDKIITLEDGNKAYYRVNSTHLRTLAFKKNGWGYLIGGNPKQNSKYNVQGLIEIANSIK